MKTVKLLLLLITAAVLFSCTGEAVPEHSPAKDEMQTISLQVGLEGRGNATRTIVYYNGDVIWNGNEESISVFTAPGVQSKFSKPLGDSNIFSGSVSSTPSVFVAIYPYSEDNDMHNASSDAGYDYSITSAIPEVQESYSNSFSMETYPMAAASSEPAFTMFGLAGGLRIRTGSSDIKFIVMKGNSGETISGPLSAGLSLSDPIPVDFSMDSSKGFGHIILCDPWFGETLDSYSDYFIVLPPMTFAKGFTLYFVNSEGAVARVTTDKEIEIKRAHFSRITNINEKMEPFVSPEPVDLGLSVKWCSCDIGTIEPLDPGVTVPWGLTVPRICSEDDYPQFSFNELPMSGDAAHSLLGGEWRTPTHEEFKELADKCTWTRISGGWKVTSKINGNSIEFPDTPHWTADRGYEFKDGSLRDWDAPYLRKSVRPVLSSASIITFADSNLEAVLVAAFDKDGDGHLSQMEAASVTYEDFVWVSWGDVTRFTSFDEFKYFTGLSSTLTALSFEGWSALKSIVLPVGMKIVPKFSGCSSLVSVTISEGAEEIYGYAFSRCTSLESITLPSTMKEIGGNAFDWCNNLKSLYISSIDDWLRVDVGTNGHPFFASGGGRLYAAGKEVTEVTFPSWCTSVPRSSFCGCSNIASFNLHDGIRSIGNGAFRNCRKLEHIDMPSGLETIGDWAFYSCSELKSIDIPEGTKSIGSNAFEACVSMESISLPASLETIGYSAFSWCLSLANLYISDLKAWCSLKFNNESCHPFAALASKSGHIYLGTSEITDLVIPAGVEKIGALCFFNCAFITSLTAPSGLKEIGQSAFSGCSALVSVKLPTTLQDLSGGVFGGCSALVSVQLPSTLKTIGGGTFSGCSALPSIVLPSSLQSLGAFAFSSCSSLETIVIPENVSSIGEYAFANSGLTSIDIRPVAPPEAGEKIFGESTMVNIYVPASSVSAYKSASNWSFYRDWIQAKP